MWREVRGKMKAIQIHAKGDVGVMQLSELPIPDCGANDILVRVVAAGVNPIDWKIRAGQLPQWGERRFPFTLGWAASGTVTLAGCNVKSFRAGDDVIFYSELGRGGTYAEYVAVDASQAASKPSTMCFAAAAALPMSGQAAWAALVETARVKRGMRVLIHGAAGAVGSVAVQLAHHAGAEVIATASRAGMKFVAGLGADTVIDYRSGLIDDSVRDVDVVLDTIGGDVQESSWALLKPGGLLVATAVPPAPGRAERAGARSAFIFTWPDGSVLHELAQRVESGLLSVMVGEEFALADAPLAHRLGETRSARGKMVLHVAAPALSTDALI